MPAGRAFFDTNVLIYAFAEGDRRREIALGLLLAGGTIGVQTLNEFVNVCTGKMKMSWPEALARVSLVEELCPPAVPVTLTVHRLATRISQAYGFHVYDSLMLAAALEASCTVFYSEDMQDRQKIGGMTIRNPFAA